MSRKTRVGAWSLLAVVSLSLAGCFDDGKSAGTAVVDPGPGSGNVDPNVDPQNRAPTISGTPATSAKTNAPYTFQPLASDPDGDPLTFEVVNKPSWASFDNTTGRLAGTPSSSSTGRFGGIQIVASDGEAEDTLGPFEVVVASDTVSGSATLSWIPPTENVDGTPLMNLAGYVIRYGTRADTLDKSLKLTNPGLTSTVIEGLPAATWYFTLIAYTSSGSESAPSGVASKTIG